MNLKTYSSKELNEIIGYVDKSGHNSTKSQILARCCNAGLKIEALDTPRGMPNQYIIIEDKFHLEGEEWVQCYCNVDCTFIFNCNGRLGIRQIWTIFA